MKTPLMLCATCAVLSFSSARAAPPAGRSSECPNGAFGPATAGYAVRIATSRDGLRFEPTGQVLLRQAAHPELVKLGTGDLLAVVECAGPAAQDGQSSLWATRSPDDGKSWRAARPVHIQGLPPDVRIGSPDLVVMPSGLVRMYFAAMPAAADRPRSRSGAMILSAVTQDGVEYQLDRQTRIPCPELATARPCAFWGQRELVMLAAGEALAGRGPGGSRTLLKRLVSTDGRNFAAMERARPADDVGHVVRIDAHQWRMYLDGQNEVRCWSSSDGLRWRNEREACLKGGFDAAVSQIDDRTYLMLFCTLADPRDASVPALATAPPGDVPAGQNPASAGAGSKAPNADAQGAQSDAEAKPQSDAGAWEAFASGGYEWELGNDWNAAGEGGEWAAGSDDLGLAPVPDLRNHVDYLSWFEQNAVLPADQSAYSSYGPLIEKLRNRPDDLFSDRYNDRKSSGPPVPWNPADFPDWEKSYQATTDYIDLFRQASLDPRPYSQPMLFAPDTAPEDRLLINVLLPSLAGFRTMTKATLAQAWRTQDGTVPPEQMLTAFDTCLGNVDHLQRGPTLIGRLVAEAERSLTDEDVRWAISQGVLQSPRDLEATLNLLQSKDLPAADPGGWIRNEHAVALDTIQYLFESPTPGGQPVLRPERLERLLDLEGSTGENRERQRQDGLRFTADDAQAAVVQVDAYFRKMADWYTNEMPRPDPKQFDREAEQMYEKNKLSGMFIPSLARANVMMQRTEASRRATRLACSLELFRATRGRYPGSLDELPADQVQDVRTDPFSGRDFVYRITDQGPTIYSVSDNGQDDGGVHSRVWGDYNRKTPSDDHVFWPPQK